MMAEHGVRFSSLALFVDTSSEVHRGKHPGRASSFTERSHQGKKHHQKRRQNCQKENYYQNIETVGIIGPIQFVRGESRLSRRY